MSLAQAIERAHRANEQKVSSRIAVPILELSAGEKNALGLFQSWARDRGVKALPAAPAVVAAYVRSEAEAGIDTQHIVLALQAIEKAHDAYLLPNPIATVVVRAELGAALKIEPPRWKPEEKALFFAMPPDIQAVIAFRSKRDSDLIKRLQNENALLYKFAYCELNSINQKGPDNDL